MRHADLCRGISGRTLALAIALSAAPVFAQAADGNVPDSSDVIVVTGSRIDIGGFESPTPTTVVDAIDLRLGGRPGIAQALNDMPQFRATTTPQTTNANTNSGTTAADLRGLGSIRTLTLLNGRRSIGTNDLNFIPMQLVKRVDVVTGGAAAAYGSGAVAGVVNIILDEEMKGIRLDAQTGIASRGDAARYSVDASYGTSFADDRAHFMIGGSWAREMGAFDRFSRENVGSTALFPNPAYAPGNGEAQFVLMPDVNFADASTGGLIVNGALAGQTFNADGTLRPFQFGNPRNATLMVGGEGMSTSGERSMTAPYERYNGYARLSYDVSDSATLWVDGLYSNISAKYLFYSEVARGNLTFSRDNPFLRPEIRNQLLAAGQTSFKMGRFFTDYGQRIFNYRRSTWEGGVGLDGSFADGRWKYGLFFSHGEFRDLRGYDNQRVTTNFAQAIDAVRDANGNIVCRVALTDPSTACRPLNVFGSGNASPEAVKYAFASASGGTKTTLDSGGASIRGEAFSLWAGPVAVAAGFEARREGISSLDIDPISLNKGFTQLNFSPLDGSFDVKEGFAEATVPLLDMQDVAEIAVNGAARYSDYSNTGGIWSWKLGGTARLFDQLMLRVTRSRDIRSPALSELFTTRTTTYSTVADPWTGGTAAVVRYGGGNENLEPEVAQTFTAGATWSPDAVRGLQLSIDYYRIDIDGIIVTPTAQDIVTRCFKGMTAMCNQIERQGGQITTIYATFVNFAQLKTDGVDFEARYQFPLSNLFSNANGSLRLRAIGTYTGTRTSDDGLTVLETVGSVGDGTSGVPRWRVNGVMTYENNGSSFDLRVRHVSGGLYDQQVSIANNAISAKTYFDLGGRVRTGPFTFFGNIVNLFDVAPPLTTSGQIHYDQLGRYFSVGASLRF